MRCVSFRFNLIPVAPLESLHALEVLLPASRLARKCVARQARMHPWAEPPVQSARDAVRAAILAEGESDGG